MFMKNEKEEIKVPYTRREEGTKKRETERYPTGLAANLKLDFRT